jgi:hypothetical protein
LIVVTDASLVLHVVHELDVPGSLHCLYSAGA